MHKRRKIGNTRLDRKEPETLEESGQAIQDGHFATAAAFEELAFAAGLFVSQLLGNRRQTEERLEFMKVWFFIYLPLIILSLSPHIVYL